MTSTTEAQTSTVVRLPGTGRAVPRWAAPAALGAILLLSALLYGWALGSLGWGNSYYSAAVKSMGRSWTNFLFGAFDPAGVVTVDKPPAALWPQVISSKIFGLHGWALILPQLLEGVAAVFVLHRTVRRWAGEGTALIAALVMTLTPITVAINRDNNPDTLLVLFLVSAAYALTRALQSQATRRGTWWLCASGFLIGCGFLTKMMAAWMVLPALAAAWLVGASGPWLARIVRLLIAGAVCAVSSLWWVAMVAWWPGEQPYIGGSTDGGAWDLVTGYNGLGRIFGESDGSGGMGNIGGAFGGEAGLLRLFNDQVAGQISWLLPASGVALIVAIVGAVLRRRGKTSAGESLAGSGWVLWGAWLVVSGLVYSTQEGIFHPYYTTQLAPAVAALTAGLATALARAHRAGAIWALPVGAGTVLASVIWAAIVIRRVPSWNGWLAWLVLVIGLAVVALMLAAALNARLLPVALGGALLAVLLAPAAWAVSVPGGSGSAMGGGNPSAGPASMSFGGGGSFRGGGSGGAGGSDFQLPEGMEIPEGLSGMPGGTNGGGSASGTDGTMPSFPGNGGGSGSGMGRLGGATTLTSEQRKILNYATENSKGARITLAVEGGAQSAAAFILDSDATVIGMGGFMGSDDAPSVAQLEKWTKSGALRYVLGSDSSGGMGAMMGGKDSAASQRSTWIGENCTKIPAKEYGGSTTSSSNDQASGGMMGRTGTTLYDCAAK
ncbi:ArnT family glycosyltransferase [Streptomyces justiciae]|uniref:Glycosyltransferase family 39 protein n=1 Tax=Streptomyces justiciae TaxID=2780140 RepID=A0ABU3LLG3_9ACTN|nr:glycosyltransferase family 39 protein [Streptomyces justiciae]MDT7839599.1 glycosyltransferase family 39 protein [Streptomyces justiciae]